MQIAKIVVLVFLYRPTGRFLYYICRVTVQDIDDNTIDCQLYLRCAVNTSFRVYTLIAENRIAATSFRVPLLRSEFSDNFR